MTGARCDIISVGRSVNAIASARVGAAEECELATSKIARVSYLEKGEEETVGQSSKSE